ncbi:metallo-beta-lactamase superfamily protein [Bacillus sp. CAG:988]|nr:metallo-beta-lactamase superfamily protein [Bacillus sp. CAG:988]
MRRKKKQISLLMALFLVIFGSIFYFLEPSQANPNTPTPTPEIVQANQEIQDGEKLQIWFLDVGQADSILIQNGDANMLIDAGNNEDGKKLVSYFQSLGIESFQYVIGTHAHEDHIGGMDDIIDNFDIDTFYMPDAITTTATFESVLDSLEAKNIAFQTPSIDSIFKLGNATIDVLYVGTDDSDLNNTSIVLKLTYGNTSILFMGDAEKEVETIIEKKDISADVLKVGHHGSNTSSSKTFLEKVNPSYAIISVGTGNSYGHPSNTTIQNLENQNIQIYRTDENGTIIMTSDGTDITFQTIQTNTNG